MINVYKNIWVGKAKVIHLLNKNDWAYVNVSSAYHYKMMGWQKGFKYQNDPHYIHFQEGHFISVNWIDGEARFYNWQGQGVETIKKILDFIEQEKRQVYIFCDQGMSRSPSVALLYLAKRAHKISNESYDAANQDFLLLYPMYAPGGIKDFLSEHWEEIK